MSDSVEYLEDSCKNFLVPKWGKEDVLIFSDWAYPDLSYKKQKPTHFVQ